MTVRQIRKFNDAILTTPATDAHKITEQVCADLVDTLNDNPRAIGLAAQQIGELCRVIVVRQPRGPLVMICPRVEPGETFETEEPEGCMSFPGQTEMVSRPFQGMVSWQKTIGGPRSFRKFTGMDFRVIQHEIDHLDGVTLNTRRRARQKAEADAAQVRNPLAWANP